MSIWKSALISGVALSALFTFGFFNKAVSGQGYHDYGKMDLHHEFHHNSGQKFGYYKHPVYGKVLKHPVNGYKFKHPVHGYIPIGTIANVSGISSQSTVGGYGD